MLALPAALKDLIHQLTCLPGIGPKAGERLALAIIDWDEENVAALGRAFAEAARRVTTCPDCGCLSQDDECCAICADGPRDAGVLCVVESPLDAVALERGGEFQGRFHVLGGALSPVRGVLPDDLRIAELKERVAQGGVREVIVATNASPEGEATALYLKQELEEAAAEDGSVLKLTRLARGLPSGSQLDYADTATLESALKHRTEL